MKIVMEIIDHLSPYSMQIKARRFKTKLTAGLNLQKMELPKTDHEVA